MNRFPSANSVKIWARFLASPRQRVFHVTELALDDAEGVLDLGPHLGDEAVGLFVEGMQLTAFGGLAHGATLPGALNAASRAALT